MDILGYTLSSSELNIYIWENIINDWFFLAALIFLAFEFLRLTFRKEISKNMLGDSVTNFITLGIFIVINLLISAVYLSFFYFLYENFSLVQLPINVWTIIACIVLADFVYYWEHRTMHRIGIGWATHTVHHSSPYFNISVAYRFGPLDGIFPMFFHAPLVLLGFNPFLIFFSELMVQLYQTALHTETVKKLPKFIENVMNTPSHHRVHHGSNPQYIDKNYAGIFIIWDKLFGTFEEEREKVTYGVVPPLNSINPIYVFFHGITGLMSKLWHTKGMANKLLLIIRPPDWQPEKDKPDKA